VTQLVTLTGSKGVFDMKSGTLCEMCGKPLSTFSKGYLCSPACRKAKSRLKQDAGKNMISARNAIRAVIKGLELNVISSRDSYSEYQELADMLNKLSQAHNDRYDRELAEQKRQER
jgi:uncharacterized Zn finger protein (UPF0148 family)